MATKKQTFSDRCFKSADCRGSNGVLQSCSNMTQRFYLWTGSVTTGCIFWNTLTNLFISDVLGLRPLSNPSCRISRIFWIVEDRVDIWFLSHQPTYVFITFKYTLLVPKVLDCRRVLMTASQRPALFNKGWSTSMLSTGDGPDVGNIGCPESLSGGYASVSSTPLWTWLLGA